MAWPATIRTWLVEPVTAPKLQEYSDALHALGDAWAAGTATFSATGGGFALGNGTVAASYSTAGKRDAAKIKLTLGTTTTIGTGRLQITVSGGMPSGIAGDAAGWAIYNDQSAVLRYSGSVFWVTSTVLELAGPTGSINSTTPFAWASTDWIAIGLGWEGA